MAPRTSWKGFLRLSLVSVPLKAYTANATDNDIRLNQLHEECHSRIKYQKTCPTHGVVGSDEIVKGYEYAKDQYVIVDDEELKRLRSESDKTVSLDGFIAADAVDPIHHSGKTYYTAPDGVVGEKPYQLLMGIMKKRGLHGIGRIVLSGREQLVLVRPIDGVLALTFLSYAQSVKPVAEFADLVRTGEVSPEEMKLTETLVDASTIRDFDLGKYEDRYNDDMRGLIQAKVDGEELVTAPDREEPQILNLMEALKKSVADAQLAAPAAAERPAARKMAKSTRARRKPAAKKKTG